MRRRFLLFSTCRAKKDGEILVYFIAREETGGAVFPGGTCRGVCPAASIESGRYQQCAEAIYWGGRKKINKSVSRRSHILQNFGEKFSRLNELSVWPAETRGKFCKEAPKGTLLLGTPYCFSHSDKSTTYSPVIQEKDGSTAHSEWGDCRSLRQLHTKTGCLWKSQAVGRMRKT